MKNVLFLLIDCLRVDRCFGPKKKAETPAIDYLSSKGIFFTNTVSHASTTTPCVASILTGTYSFVHNVKSLYGYKLNPNIVSLPQVFKNNGYRTYAEVTGPLLKETGINRGFDYYVHRSKDEHIYTGFGERLMNRLRDDEFEEPWFSFIHFFEIHGVLRARIYPEEFNTRRYGYTSYDRALSSLNSYLMKLLEYIDLDDTLIVLTGDHGHRVLGPIEKLWLKGELKLRRGLRLKMPKVRFSGHGYHVYDYLIKVPLIFVGKDFLPEDKRISIMVRHIDILPTLIDMLKLKQIRTTTIQGRSLMPMIRGEVIPEAPAYIEAYGAMMKESERLMGIRTSRYKFIYAPKNKEIPQELYDLEKDPNEKRNLATTRPEIVHEMRRILEEITSKETTMEYKMTPDEEEIVLDRLKKLGYIE